MSEFGDFLEFDSLFTLMLTSSMCERFTSTAAPAAIARLKHFLLIILTNAFSKKTQKTPARELNLAEQRRADYLNRKEKK